MSVKVLPLPKPHIVKLEGNVFKNAIMLEDIDDDLVNELIVGTDKGNLAVFKGTGNLAVRCAKNLGIITVLCYGDFFNIGRGILIVFTSSGLTYFYDFIGVELEENIKTKYLPHVGMHNFPENVMCATIGDLSGDGKNELIIGFSDNTIRTFKWVNSANRFLGFCNGQIAPLNRWKFPDQIGSFYISPNIDGKPYLIVPQPGASVYRVQVVGNTRKKNKKSEKNIIMLTEESPEFDNLDGNCICSSDTTTEILGGFDIDSKATFDHFQSLSSSPLSPEKFLGLKPEEDVPGHLLVTNDGFVMLYRDNKLLWKVNLEDHLVSLSLLRAPKEYEEIIKENKGNIFYYNYFYSQSPSVSMTSLSSAQSTSTLIDADRTSVTSGSTFCFPYDVEETEEDSPVNKKLPKIVTCTPDGQTYVIDVVDGSIVTFQFNECVNAFTSGYYGVNQLNLPSFVYVNHHGRIFIYFEITESIEEQPSLYQLQQENSLFMKCVEALGIDADDEKCVGLLSRYLMHGDIIDSAETGKCWSK